MEIQTPRQKYTKRHESLKKERSTWLEHWRDLADYIQPRKFRYLFTDTNKGTKQNTKIINGTPTRAARILASGMMAGITSPARPWFRLSTPDRELNQSGAVKVWLSDVEDAVRQALAKSNVYNGLHQAYEGLGTFGSVALYIEEDADDLIRAYNFPIGQYCLANSARLAVDTVYRELSMTVGQLIERFGQKNCSQQVRSMYEQNDLESWVQVLHVIEPNRESKRGAAGPKGMLWRSCWLESGRSQEGGDEGYLRESGYEEFPVLAPRWSVTGEDVYGASPGMDALGDARALQLLEKRKAQAIDKIVNPPMRGPASLNGQRTSLLPGDVTYVDALSPGQTFAPAMEINPNAVSVIGMEIREYEKRVNEAYYADLWLMIAANPNTPDMTAREVAERHEEKMLQLGPVLERLGDELLDPLIARVFGILNRLGRIPPPPEELQGMDLKVEYVSILAQAQKMIGITGLERVAGFAGNLAAAKPEVLDKVDFDQMMDEYSEMAGTPPGIIRTDEQVAKIREGRAQQQQQQAAMEQAQVAAQGAKTLSETDLSGDSALTRMLGTLGGAAGNVH